MRLTTIWTLPALTLGERLLRTRDWLAMTVAARLPLRLRYWVTMLEIVHATKSSPNIPATPLDQILRNLRAPNDKGTDRSVPPNRHGPAHRWGRRP